MAFRLTAARLAPGVARADVSKHLTLHWSKTRHIDGFVTRQLAAHEQRTMHSLFSHPKEKAIVWARRIIPMIPALIYTGAIFLYADIEKEKIDQSHLP